MERFIDLETETLFFVKTIFEHQYRMKFDLDNKVICFYQF